MRVIFTLIRSVLLIVNLTDSKLNYKNYSRTSDENYTFGLFLCHDFNCCYRFAANVKSNAIRMSIWWGIDEVDSPWKTRFVLIFKNDSVVLLVDGLKPKRHFPVNKLLDSRLKIATRMKMIEIKCYFISFIFLY